MVCTIHVAKTKVLTSLRSNCAFVFALAKIRFSRDEAHILISGLQQE